MDSNLDASIDPAIESQSGIFTKFALESDLGTHGHSTTDDTDAQGAAHAALLAHHQQGSYSFADIASNPHTSIDHHEIDEASVDAAAAANLSSIINFNQMENDSVDPVQQQQQENDHSRSQHSKHQSQLSFLQNALALSQNDTNASPSAASAAAVATSESTGQPKQLLIKDPSSKVSIVVVNPAQKDGTGRLGRPRRPTEKNPEKAAKILAEDSSNNKEECLVSRFRVDSKPIMGPGSRGGKGHSKKASRSRKSDTPKGAKFINVVLRSPDDEKKNPDTPTNEDQSTGTVSDPETLGENETGEVKSEDDVVVLSESSKPPYSPTAIAPAPTSDSTSLDGPVFASSSQVTIPSSHQVVFSAAPGAKQSKDSNFILENYESLKAKGRSTQRDKQDIFSKLGLIPLMPKNNTPAPSTSQPTSAAPSASPQPQLSSTTQGEKKHTGREPGKRKKAAITKARNQKRKDIPGPITPFYWDPYDPELLQLSSNSETKSDLDMIALGYQVKPAPFAQDIITILSFITKFKKFFDGLPNLGPQDFEEGLKLDYSPPLYDLGKENAKQIQIEQPAKKSDEIVSDTMDLLLRMLLKLLLNRKREIPKSGLSKALSDLKLNVLNYGLPEEWRDDKGVYVPPDIDESLKNPENSEPVDPQNLEFFDTIQYHFDTTKPLEHTPLDNSDFETIGLQSLEPADRLVLLRSMTQWCCAYSDGIRQEINAQINRQDASGEKETYYVSRYIKEGDEGVDAANNSLKLHPRKKIKKDEDTLTLDAYTDATVNPLDHHMSFRLIDFYAGDAGVNGRFFLCRSADSTTGGFSTVAELKQLLCNETTTQSLLNLVQPSRFKLYVEDVTTMLGSVLQTELNLKEGKRTADLWYEVAGSAAELSDFVAFLGSKLETLKSNLHNNLYEYLKSMETILVKFESIYTEYTANLLSRESRKRAPVVDLKAQDRKLRKIIKRNEKPGDEFLRDDSDEEIPDEDDEDDEEEFALEAGEEDDDDDDDYKG